MLQAQQGDIIRIYNQIVKKGQQIEEVWEAEVSFAATQGDETEIHIMCEIPRFFILDKEGNLRYGSRIDYGNIFAVLEMARVWPYELVSDKSKIVFPAFFPSFGRIKLQEQGSGEIVSARVVFKSFRKQPEQIYKFYVFSPSGTIDFEWEEKSKLWRCGNLFRIFEQIN